MKNANPFTHPPPTPGISNGRSLISSPSWLQAYYFGKMFQFINRDALNNVDAPGCGTSVVRGPTGHK